MARLHRRFATGAYGLPAPSLSLDFILDPSSALSTLTFTRASAGTYFDSAGVLQTALTNVARIDFSQSTLAALGLLIEEARTNVVLWNRDLTNAAWTATDVTVAKTATGIDGVANSASTLTATAGNGTVLQAITLASSARFQTAWVKRRTGTGVINMTMDNGATWTAITVTSSWSRLSIPTQTLANPTVGFRIVTSGDAIDVDYVQNENGAFATSSIATTTASVTRAADVCSIALSAFPYNSAEMTFSADFDAFSPSSGSSFGVLGVGSAGRALYTNTGKLNIFDGTAAATSGNSITANAVTRGASSFGPLGLLMSLNGGTVVTAAYDGAFGSSPTDLFIGGFTNASQLNGHIRRVALYPRQMSSIQHQALTA